MNETTNIETTTVATEPTKKQTFISMQTAAFVSIALCISLYFSLLFAVFTKEVNTFKVYTQDGMSTLHSTTECKSGINYIASRGDGKNGYTFDFTKPIITTTTYECSDKAICSRCRSELKEITITAKDYITPIFISVGMSALTFLILVKIKKTA
jgi:hypothetical protein